MKPISCRPACLVALLAVVILSSIARAQDGGDPLQLTIDYTWEAGRNTMGGLKRGNFQLGNLDIQAQYDASSLGSAFRGTTLFFYGLGNHGSNPSEFAGDAQGLSNITAPKALRLYEGWVEKLVASDRASLLFGLYDLNSEFDAVASSGLFLNSSFGIGVDFSQSGGNGPSIFTVTSLALRLRAALGRNLYAQGVVLDGVPGLPEHPTHTHVVLSRADGALLVGEIGYLRADDGVAVSRTQDGDHSFRASIGAWSYTSESEVLLGGATRLNRGAYGAVDGRVYSESAEDRGSLSLFARLGVANEAVNRFHAYLGAGAVYTGIFPGRDNDSFGIAVASAINSKTFRDAAAAVDDETTAAESSFELTYFAQLFDWMSVQLDTQYIINPDTRPDLDNAFVASLRWVFSFSPRL